MWEKLLEQILSQDFVKALAGLVVLIAVDLLFGVWRAIKEGEFKWTEVGRFYRTMVVPGIGGWVTMHVAMQLIDFFGLKDIAPGLGSGVDKVALAGVVAWITANVVVKIKAVFGMMPGKQ